mgnify:CR=1 FL=1
MASHYAPRKARFGPLKKIVLGILQFVLGLAVLLAALWGIFTLIAKHQSFVESYYQVQSDKLTSNVRVVQLSDLHLHEFGDHNAELIERITALKPDIIAITGDMNDKLVDDYSVVTDLCTELVKIAPVYYVPGNHEWPKIVFHNSPIGTDLEAIGVHRRQGGQAAGSRGQCLLPPDSRALRRYSHRHRRRGRSTRFLRAVRQCIFREF